MSKKLGNSIIRERIAKLAVKEASPLFIPKMQKKPNPIVVNGVAHISLPELPRVPIEDIIFPERPKAKKPDVYGMTEIIREHDEEEERLRGQSRCNHNVLHSTATESELAQRPTEYNHLGNFLGTGRDGFKVTNHPDK